MEHRSGIGPAVPALLLFASGLTLAVAVARVVQVPTNTLPADAAKFAATPLPLFAHALAGTLFGVLGPLQFWTALRVCFARAHRLSGRVFVASGVVLGLSGLSLVHTFWEPGFGMVEIARVVFSAALLAALWLAIARIRARDLPGHRAFMIRAYAVGMGTAPLAFVFLPIYLITGTPPMGLAADLIFVGLWLASIGLGEWVIWRLRTARQLAFDQ